MPKLDSVRFEGLSGETYELHVYTWGHELKSVAAIYVVMERRVEPGREPQYLPVYVAETPDLSGVFNDDRRSGCFQAYYANTIGVLAEADDARRVRVVSDLLGALEPPCNGVTTCEEFAITGVIS